MVLYKNRVPKYSDSYYNFYNWYFRYDFDRNRWMNTLLNHEKLIVELSLDNKITRKEAEYIIEKLNPEEICRVLTMISRWYKLSINNNNNNTEISYESMMVSDAIELLINVRNSQTNTVQIKPSRVNTFYKDLSNKDLLSHFKI